MNAHPQVNPLANHPQGNPIDNDRGGADEDRSFRTGGRVAAGLAFGVLLLAGAALRLPMFRRKHFQQRVEQHGLAYRLDQKCVQPGSLRARPYIFPSESCDHHEPGRLAQPSLCTDGPGGRRAVKARHVPVQYYEAYRIVRVPGFEGGERP